MPCPIKAATATSGSSGFCGWKSITVHWNTLCLGILIHSINPHAISEILVHRNFQPMEAMGSMGSITRLISFLHKICQPSHKSHGIPSPPLKPLVVHVVMETRWLHNIFQGPPISLSIPTPQSCQIRGYWSHLPFRGLKHMTVQGERISPTTTFLFLYFWMITAIDWRIGQIT
jgi:hypothetical protein